MKTILFALMLLASAFVYAGDKDDIDGISDSSSTKHHSKHAATEIVGDSLTAPKPLGLQETHDVVIPIREGASTSTAVITPAQVMQPTDLEAADDIARLVAAYDGSCGTRCNKRLACFDRFTSTACQFGGLFIAMIPEILQSYIPEPYRTIVTSGGIILTAASTLLSKTAANLDPEYGVYEYERQLKAQYMKTQISKLYGRPVPILPQTE